MAGAGFLDLTVPEHAYLFGFLQGDGTLKRGSGRKGQLSVELSARDVDVLEEFQELVPFYSSIRRRTRRTNFSSEHTSAIWTVCALEAREWLRTLGLPVGRKDHEIAPPTVAFSELDYLRGLLDADGSVGITTLGLPFVSLTTSSDAIKDFFLAACPILPGRPRVVNRNRRDAVFNPMATRECASQLASTLYYDGCLALARKMNAAAEARVWSRPPPARRSNSNPWTQREDRVALRYDIAEAAQRLGRTKGAVYGHVRELRIDQRILARAQRLRELRLFYDPL